MVMSDPSDQQPPAAEPSGPHEVLGTTPDASFEDVQAAKQARLAEAGDDPMARSRVEAAYDALLMERLKQRQAGKVSTAARTASAREQLAPPPPRLAMPALPQLPMPKVASPAIGMPRLELAEGTDLALTLGGFGLLLALLLLLPTASAELILALTTGLCVVCLQRRRRRFLAAVGWGFAALTLGLILGGLVAGSLAGGLSSGLPLTEQQVQSLPALVLLFLVALLVA
jgi:hypothetical protein